MTAQGIWHKQDREEGLQFEDTMMPQDKQDKQEVQSEISECTNLLYQVVFENRLFPQLNFHLVR
jgi:hypothetical protein